MSQTSDFGQRVPDQAEQTRRVSLLAISSLVTGILSFLVCCLPLVGLIPTLLGIAGIIAVGRSGGRLGGRGLAITGLVLGIISLIISTFIWIGGMMSFGQLGPVYGQAYGDDPAVVRTILTTDASTELTEEDVAAFHGALVADYGEPITIPSGVLEMVKGYAATGGPPALDDPNFPYEPGLQYNVVPLPMQTPDGWMYAYAILSGQEKLGSGMPALVNAGFTAKDGSFVWLLDPATATGQSPQPAPADEGEAPEPDPGG